MTTIDINFDGNFLGSTRRIPEAVSAQQIATSTALAGRLSYRTMPADRGAGRQGHSLSNTLGTAVRNHDEVEDWF